MKNYQIKTKLAIFANEGAYQCLVDMLRLFDEEMGTATNVNDEWYLFYVRKLKQKYEKELIVDKTNSKQIDLEDLIEEVKKENNEKI